MTTEKIDNISVTTQANVYFDGKCVSHGITYPDGTKKSVGVILPATLTFNTGAPEIMECVAGACEYKLAGSEVWSGPQLAKSSAYRAMRSLIFAWLKVTRRTTTSATLVDQRLILS